MAVGGGAIPVATSCTVGAKNTPCMALVHRTSDGELIVEFERVSELPDVSIDLERFVPEIVAAASLQSLCDEAARIFRELTGYDRVMIYRFDDEGHGEVFAEIGAVRRSLVLQFIGESILMALLAALIALVLVDLTIPYFNTLTQVKLSIPWQSPLFWLAALAFVVLTGVLAGSYPAFYLSSFRPIKVLKGMLQNGNALIRPRKVLVVVQFVCSICLINFTLIYQKQIHHELSREIGYAKDKLVFHPLTDDLRRNYAAVKNELIDGGIVESVSQSSSPITRIGSNPV